MKTERPWREAKVQSALRRRHSIALPARQAPVRDPGWRPKPLARERCRAFSEEFDERPKGACAGCGRRGAIGKRQRAIGEARSAIPAKGEQRVPYGARQGQ
jgi:hypothetical protein